MSSKFITLLRTSFEEYLDKISEHQFEPKGDFLSYDFSFLKDRKWYLMSELMVDCELRELTNNINHWSYSLHRWQAWNIIIAKHDEDSAWILRREFLESIAHECLLRPSSIRDTFISVATNALHQARLSISSAYLDVLEGDPLCPSENPKHLTRRQKEVRLATIASVWPSAKVLISLFRHIDSLVYRKATSDYRNLNSHTIGPRLGVGHTRTVTRKVEPKKELKDIGGGRYEEVLVPGKIAVGYDFGGTAPLDLEEARVLNLEQFNVARSCYLQYRALLENISANIPVKNADS